MHKQRDRQAPWRNGPRGEISSGLRLSEAWCGESNGGCSGLSAQRQWCGPNWRGELGLGPSTVLPRHLAIQVDCGDRIGPRPASRSPLVHACVAGGRETLDFLSPVRTSARATNLFITQGGFPWGRTVLPVNTTNTPTGTQILPSNFADPNRLSNLALFYSQFANSDEVQRMIASRVGRAR